MPPLPFLSPFVQLPCSVAIENDSAIGAFEDGTKGLSSLIWGLCIPGDPIFADYNSGKQAPGSSIRLAHHGSLEQCARCGTCLLEAPGACGSIRIENLRGPPPLPPASAWRSCWLSPQQVESFFSNKTDFFTPFDKRLQICTFFFRMGSISIAIHQALQTPVGFGGKAEIRNGLHQFQGSLNNGFHLISPRAFGIRMDYTKIHEQCND